MFGNVFSSREDAVNLGILPKLSEYGSEFDIDAIADNVIDVEAGAGGLRFRVVDGEEFWHAVQDSDSLGMSSVSAGVDDGVLFDAWDWEF